VSEALVDRLAGAIIDGTPIDWAVAESTADDTDRAVVTQLRRLARLAEVHREPPAAAPGQRDERLQNWGHLRLLERIGRGAFGDVYRAWDTRLDREVALKLLPARSTSNNTRDASIIEEGRLLARVRHPNVVTIYGAERIGERIGLWMELVRGSTLEQVLHRGKVFTPAEAIDIGIELCRAISAVHEAGLLHRDIKTHNVMLAEDGRVVLMDFGTGREFDDRSARAAGTPLYLAPEVLRGGSASVRSEIYSLGVLLFHLVTGSYPVRGDSLEQLREVHNSGQRTDVRTARPDLPVRLARIIERAIDPDPERRHHSVRDLEIDLARLKARRKMVPMAYAAAALVVLVAVVAWQLSGRRSSGGTRRGASFAAAAAATANPFEHPIIAVLPLKNLSAEADSDYFVDGLTDEIIRNLAEVKGLEIRSRTSSFFFKDKPRNLAEIAGQLNVNLIVEGSVLRTGGRLRVNAQLVKAAGDMPLWSERFDRDLKDVFAIEDEISRAIVNKLRLTLGRGQRRYETNLEAYDLYLKARTVLERRGEISAKEAVALFKQVIAKDAGFAPAYAGLALAYSFWSYNYFGLPYAEGLSRMRPAATKALELDPLLAEAHAAMGALYSRERDWEHSEQSFQRAIELNPSLTQTYTQYSISTLIPLGKLTEAERLLEQALRTDPLSLDVRREMATAQIASGKYEEALKNARSVRSVDPNYPFVDLQIARALTFGGRPAEALAEFEAKWQGKPGAMYWLAYPLVMTGRRADVEKMPLGDDRYPYRQLVMYSALGDKDHAFEALDRAAVVEPQRVGYILVNPETAVLRGDPRLAVFRKRFGLPEPADRSLR